jgi:2-polyprenyl-3-methyl-5-hydroxy-6-metoxy-1,4-benzoquinol methylase
MQPVHYWEDRARSFATQGEGLAAVCSYGMPEFYNRAIHLTQRLALAPWLRDCSGKRVLDVGCGVGRWSRRLAARGATVTGIDLSPTMISEANRRADAAGVSERCRFLIQDISDLGIAERFDRILAVTVLQHILEPVRLRNAVHNLAGRLVADGRLILIEAAPNRATTRCDSPVFTARCMDSYLDLFRECGLIVRAVTGVDPSPFRTAFLPYYRRLPRLIGTVGLGMVTALSVPIDALFGRHWVAQSWHKLFVLERTPKSGEER